MGGNLYTVTLEDIAHWPKSNYVNPVQRLWLPPYAIAWCIVSTIPVAARLYLRLRKKSGAYGLDDAFIFVSWVFAITLTVVCCVAVYDYQIGRHIWDINPAVYRNALYTAWLGEILFITSTACTKLAVLSFYHRLIREEHGQFWKRANYVLIAVTACGYFALFWAYVFMCSPANAYWDIHSLLANEYKCINGDALTVWSGVFTVASDFWCAALPCAMFQFHDLGVNRRQKTALNVIFCLGFLVTGVGIARTYFLWQIGHNMDISWTGYALFTAAITECQLGIVCTCAPFLRAFIRRYPPTTVRTSISGQHTRIVSSIYARNDKATEQRYSANPVPMSPYSDQPNGERRGSEAAFSPSGDSSKARFSYELQPVRERDFEKDQISLEMHAVH